MSKRANSLTVIFTSLLLGSIWLGLEVAFIAWYDPIVELAEAASAARIYAPWQLLLFLLISIPVAVIATVRTISHQQAGWLLMWLATLFFVFTQTALAMYRSEELSFVQSALYVFTACIIFSALLGAVASINMLLPERIKAGWALGGFVGWSLFFIPMLSRSGAPLGFGAIRVEDWLGYQSIPEIAIAMIAALVVATLVGREMPKSAAIAVIAALLALPLQPELARAAQPTRTPDILMILIDTMRGDHLGANATDQDTASLTPNLDALAKEGINFTNAFSGSNSTKQSMPTVFASLPVSVTGFPLKNHVPLMTQFIKDAGYETYGATANPLVSVAFGYEKGFDYLHDANQSPDFLITGILRIVARAFAAQSYNLGLVDSALYYEDVSSLSRRLLSKIDQAEGPAFGYMQTMDVHGPYLPKKQFLDDNYNPDDFYSYFDYIRFDEQLVNAAEITPANLNNMRQRYRGEIRATDVALGEMFEQLKAMDRWDETLIWVFADHGEAFGEHDSSGHTGSNYGNEVIRIPMIVKLPVSMGIEPRVVTTPVSGYDVLPTTLSILGLPPHELALGRNISPLFTGGAIDGAVFSGAIKIRIVLDWPWKFRANVDTSEALEITPVSLYNLESDWFELNDVIDDHPEIVARLQQETLKRERRIAEINIDNAAIEITDKMRERLRSLGYIE